MHVLVPQADSDEQANGSQSRLGQRQHDAPEAAERRAAVDGGGLEQFVRNAGEEAAHQDRVVSRDTARDDDGQHVVHKAQILDGQVGGDHAAAEHHGEQDQAAHQNMAGHILLDQDISAHGDDEQAGGGAHNGGEHRDQERAVQAGGGQNHLISRKIDLAGPQAHAVARRVDGVNNDLQQRQHHHAHQHAQQQNIKDQKDGTAAVALGKREPVLGIDAVHITEPPRLSAFCSAYCRWQPAG